MRSSLGTDNPNDLDLGSSSPQIHALASVAWLLHRLGWRSRWVVTSTCCVLAIGMTFVAVMSASATGAPVTKPANESESERPLAINPLTALALALGPGGAVAGWMMRAGREHSRQRRTALAIKHHDARIEELESKISVMSLDRDKHDELLERIERRIETRFNEISTSMTSMSARIDRVIDMRTHGD